MSELMPVPDGRGGVAGYVTLAPDGVALALDADLNPLGAYDGSTEVDASGYLSDLEDEQLDPEQLLAEWNSQASELERRYEHRLPDRDLSEILEHAVEHGQTMVEAHDDLVSHGRSFYVDLDDRQQRRDHATEIAQDLSAPEPLLPERLDLNEHGDRVTYQAARIRGDDLSGVEVVNGPLEAVT